LTNKALFLDRDGVINKEKNYLYKIEDIDFIDGIFDLCFSATQLGYKIIIITNQAGIARGYYSEQDFKIVSEWVENQFMIRKIKIAGTFFCPHHPKYGNSLYKIDCDCRKPRGGMIREAAIKHGINLSNSIFVGDKKSDMLAAKATHIGTKILVRTGHPITANDEQYADYILNSPADITALL